MLQAPFAKLTFAVPTPGSSLPWSPLHSIVISVPQSASLQFLLIHPNPDQCRLCCSNSSSLLCQAIIIKNYEQRVTAAHNCLVSKHWRTRLPSKQAPALYIRTLEAVGILYSVLPSFFFWNWKAYRSFSSAGNQNIHFSTEICSTGSLLHFHKPLPEESPSLEWQQSPVC